MSEVPGLASNCMIYGHQAIHSMHAFMLCKGAGPPGTESQLLTIEGRFLLRFGMHPASILGTALGRASWAALQRYAAE